MSFDEPEANSGAEQNLQGLLGFDSDLDSHQLLEDETKLDEWRRECEFDFDIASLLLCPAPPEKPPVDAALAEFDFDNALDTISLDEPLDVQAALAEKQRLMFAPLRPVYDACAGHPYLHWLTADVHLPESVSRWLRTQTAMAC